MIHHVLLVIKNELNSFLRRKEPAIPREEEKVILSDLMKMDGTVAFQGENKVVCSLLNIEQERTNLNFSPAGPEKKNPPVNINIYLLFSSFFQSDQTDKSYWEGLKFLSYVIAFFQGKQVFTPANTPGLPASLEKVSVEIVNLDMRELSNFWTAVGSKLLPSVIYKLRMLSITEDMILEDIPEITGVEAGTGVSP